MQSQVGPPYQRNTAQYSEVPYTVQYSTEWCPWMFFVFPCSVSRFLVHAEPDGAPAFSAYTYAGELPSICFGWNACRHRKGPFTIALIVTVVSL